jgi:hypothetical protein
MFEGLTLWGVVKIVCTVYLAWAACAILVGAIVFALFYFFFMRPLNGSIRRGDKW